MLLEWLIIIFCMTIAAWYLGFHTPREPHALKQKSKLPKDYLLGLNFLLNEEQDKAVDIFIKMLEVDSETVETHLAVAKLFRKRGEADRAIRIHQNLIARPHLDPKLREESLFELGQDYLSAGVLDRAEKVFLELVASKKFTEQALRALLHIYQQTKSWHNAIYIARELATVTNQNYDAVIAHHHCELAEIAFSKNEVELAQKYLKDALDSNYLCARASLVHAKIEMEAGNFRNALKSLKRVKDQNGDYLPEAIEPLAVCYESLDEKEKLVSYLKDILAEFPQLSVVQTLSQRIQQWQGEKAAAEVVGNYVRQHPSLEGLHLFLDLHLADAYGQLKNDLLLLKGLTQKLLSEKLNYQCLSCGYSGNTLLWQCPGCHQWEMLKKID